MKLYAYNQGLCLDHSIPVYRHADVSMAHNPCQLFSRIPGSEVVTDIKAKNESAKLLFADDGSNGYEVNRASKGV